jgi:hypothetical protein
MGHRDERDVEIIMEEVQELWLQLLWQALPLVIVLEIW